MICMSNPENQETYGLCSGDSGSKYKKMYSPNIHLFPIILIFFYLYKLFYFTLTFKNVGPLTIKGKGNEPATILGVISGGYKACKGVAVCGDITSVLPWIKNTLGL